MQDYYGQMRERSLHAQTFSTIKEYKKLFRKEYQIISSQWESIVKINRYRRWRRNIF
ncbi:hypothetical protein KHA80_21650 [Anaerobacillus sp. HL2]|nr:hypothetical protein KHA80_21650 [Anaerobacillus sp. HL2]